MTSKFEQLIEYVINNEEAKANELFHEIVVEKSRQIYESLMEESDAERDDKAEKAGKKVTKDIEYDEKKDRADESIGGDSSDKLIDEIETDEEGMNEDGEEEEEEGEEEEEEGEEEEESGAEEFDAGEESEHEEHEDIEDRVIDLEDKLDELMAEFEALMGDEGHEGGEEIDAEFDMEPIDGDVGGDDFATDDTLEFDDEVMAEGVSLKAVSTPKGGDDGANKKSPVPTNSGARGAMANPVKPTGTEAKGRPAPSTKDLPDAGNFKNVPGKDGSKLAPAPKPVTAQAAGTNSKTPFPKV